MRNCSYALLRAVAGPLLRFRRDQSGNYLIIMGLMMPVLIGCVGLATDYGVWLHTHQSMQGAADSAAISAATAERLSALRFPLS
jgi:Flp pilus assembly protein TadG